MDIHDGSPLHMRTSTSQAHAHRLDHNPSKLPAFRFVDLSGPPLAVVPSRALLAPDQERAHVSDLTATTQGTTSPQRDRHPPKGVNATTPLTPSSSAKPSFSTPSTAAALQSLSQSDKTPTQSTPRELPKPHERRLRKAPASHSNRAYGVETFSGPPPALSTQRPLPIDQRPRDNSTNEWALTQRTLTLDSFKSPHPATADDQPTTTKARSKTASRSVDETASTRPLIPPIRSFRSSTSRAILEMNGRSIPTFEAEEDQETDRDRTLRALEGFPDEEKTKYSGEKSIEMDQASRNTASEDLFLTLARDGSARDFQAEDLNPNRADQRRSRIALASSRQSLPVSNSLPQPDTPQMYSRSSDRQSLSSIRHRGEGAASLQSERISYRPLARDRTSSALASPTGEIQKPKYATAASRSSPMTPRDVNEREQIFEARQSFGGRGTSMPEPSSGVPLRTASYRQSNLSYTTSQTNNPSSLVGSSAEIEYETQVPKNRDGTESTASTTAPSTVWDELDDLKSRIRKLELTGKLPATSGAAVSHASGERPPTATTTNTTVSTSPLRGRRLSSSPTDSIGVNMTVRETHPLLQSALAKSKPLLRAEVFKALESAASDALDLASILGTAGQPGPMSSAQSVIGSTASTVTDRQLRRKADSMCRSLTELCLALSDGGTTPPVSQLFAAPGSREMEFQNGTSDTHHRLTNNEGLQGVKFSPRAGSRLEARRSSLLASSSLPAPRYAPSDVGTPTQVSTTGRRSSLLLRNRRAGTEELEDEESRIRAPSRATTDIGLIRNSQREYTSMEPLPDRRPSISSNLPTRRQYNSTNISPASAIQNFSARRYLDRNPPERDTSSVIGRLAEDRGLKAPMFEQSLDGQGITRSGSLLRRSRQNNMDSSTALQVRGHQ